MNLGNLKGYEDLSFSQWSRIGDAIGGIENLAGVLSGEVRIDLVNTLESLFDDNNGWRIPDSIKTQICDPKKNHQFNDYGFGQLPIFSDTYQQIIERIEQCLGVRVKITAEKFEEKIEFLTERISSDKSIASVFKGAWIPVVLPRVGTSDIGTILEKYLKAVTKSYLNSSEDRRIGDSLEQLGCNLAGDISVFEGGRTTGIIDRMLNGPVVGIYFPGALRGFSVQACLEQMKDMCPVKPHADRMKTIASRGFSISGLDSLIAAMLFPNFFLKGDKTDAYPYKKSPKILLASLRRRSDDCSLCLGVERSKLEFGGAATTWTKGDTSSGLFYSM